MTAQHDTRQHGINYEYISTVESVSRTGSPATRSGQPFWPRPGPPARGPGGTDHGARMGAVGGHQRRRQGIPDQGGVAGSEERRRKSHGGGGHADYHGRTQV